MLFPSFALPLLLLSWFSPHFRRHPHGHRRANYWSDDRGVTWSSAEKSGLSDSILRATFHGCEASLMNVNNTLFAFHPGPYGRVDMRVHCSLDHGKTWPAQFPITATHIGGYSDLIHAPDSRDGTETDCCQQMVCYRNSCGQVSE